MRSGKPTARNGGKRPLKLMIVDDSNIMRRRIERSQQFDALQLVGTAGNGVEAIELFKRTDPDVVTMDLTMPRMDGIECISRLVALKPEVRILVVSALCITLKSSFSGATETRIAQTTESRPSLAPDKNRELQTRMASTRNLYEQHVSLWNLLTQRQWIWLSCRSFFGDFGWMSFHLTTYYYCIVIVVFGALLFCIVRATKMEANFPPICWFTVLVIGANISSAIAFSWLFDLQPQGRYLFPSLLALGWMLSRLQNWQNSRVIFGLILILAILGTYAFTCYAVIPLKEHVPSSFL